MKKGISAIRSIALVCALMGSALAQQEIKLWEGKSDIRLWFRQPITIIPLIGETEVTFTVICPQEDWSLLRPAQLPDWVESMSIEAAGVNIPLSWKVDEPVKFTLSKALVKEGSLVLRVTRFRAGCSIGRAENHRVSLQLVMEGGDSHLPELVADAAGLWWRNGYNGSPDLRLPGTASIEQVMEALFRSHPDTHGRHVTSHHSLEARRLLVRNFNNLEAYTAVLADTDLGRKLILVRYEENQQWFGRFFDVASPP